MWLPWGHVPPRGSWTPGPSSPLYPVPGEGTTGPKPCICSSQGSSLVGDGAACTSAPLPVSHGSAEAEVNGVLALWWPQLWLLKLVLGQLLFLCGSAHTPWFCGTHIAADGISRAFCRWCVVERYRLVQSNPSLLKHMAGTALVTQPCCRRWSTRSAEPRSWQTHTQRTRTTHIETHGSALWVY